MDRQKVIELAREAGLAYGSDEKPLSSVERFAALIEREVRGDSEPVAWIITRKTAKNGLRKYAVLGSYSLASAHCDVGSPEPLYSHSVSVNAEIVGTVKELFTNSALERLDLRPSTKVYIAPPTPAPAASAESVASVHIKDGCLIGSQRKSGVDIPDGQYALYPIGTFPSSAVDVEQDRIDAECFRFWVREAAVNPVGMAKLISKCITEQEYRDAIIPCVEKAKAAIAAAKKAVV